MRTSGPGRGWGAASESLGLPGRVHRAGRAGRDPARVSSQCRTAQTRREDSASSRARRDLQSPGCVLAKGRAPGHLGRCSIVGAPLSLRMSVPVPSGAGECPQRQPGLWFRHGWASGWVTRDMTKRPAPTFPSFPYPKTRRRFFKKQKEKKESLNTQKRGDKGKMA